MKQPQLQQLKESKLTVRTRVQAGGNPDVCYSMYMNCLGSCATAPKVSECFGRCAAEHIQCMKA
jgi:hypothetical protein